MHREVKYNSICAHSSTIDPNNNFGFTSTDHLVCIFGHGGHEIYYRMFSRLKSGLSV